MAQTFNYFTGCIDDWKIDLIHHRARLQGFRPDEMPDVEQDIALEIVNFQHDPAKGGSEKTALTALIDRRLTMIIRCRVRRQKRQAKYYELNERPEASCDIRDAHRDDDMTMDVGEALSALDERSQVVCAELAQGTSRLAIAKRLQVSRYEVDRIIDVIRNRFTAAGLQAWLVN